MDLGAMRDQHVADRPANPGGAGGDENPKTGLDGESVGD